MMLIHRLCSLARQNNGAIGATVALLLVELLTGLAHKTGLCVYGRVNLDGCLVFATGLMPTHLTRCFETMGKDKVLVDKGLLALFRRGHQGFLDELPPGKEVRGVETMWEVLDAAYRP
jgi:hypothetical protein